MSVEYRAAHDRRAVVVAGIQGRCDQHGYPPTVSGGHVHRHLADRVLHAQQGREMCLVVDPATDREEIRQTTSTDQVLTVVPEPPHQRRVDLDDGSVEQRGQIATGGVLIQFLDGRVLRGHCRSDRRAPARAAVGSTAHA
jgi:hypothetical protein